jgi:hypothetical protein
MKIVNPKGKWYINNGLHSFHDPESFTVFEPGLLTKATETSWLKGQPTIQEAVDPLAIDTVKEVKQKPSKGD